jgi:hypothetical protein
LLIAPDPGINSAIQTFKRKQQEQFLPDVVPWENGTTSGCIVFLAIAETR